MKRKKIYKVTSRKVRFDPTELLLLAFMTLVLMIIVTWQLGYLPDFLTKISQEAVLGASIAR